MIRLEFTDGGVEAVEADEVEVDHRHVRLSRNGELVHTAALQALARVVDGDRTVWEPDEDVPSEA